MIQLRVHQSELTYEGAFSPPIAALIDAPGGVASAVVSQFGHLDLSISDLSQDQGSLEDRGLSFEIAKFNADVLLRADRLEIRFFSIEDTGDDAAALVQGVWQVLASVSPETTLKSHSLRFEIDCEQMTGSYHSTLEGFCSPHQNLPKGTDTAVVYYLPPDSSEGFLDSNFVLNRSAEVQGGILLAVTLVFDGKTFRPEDGFRAGRKRLEDLLSRLDLELLLKDSQTGM